MRVFLDTNVLVSAFASRGLCADLLRLVLAEHQLIVGEPVLSELRRVLRDRIKVPAETIVGVETLLREQIVVAKPSKPYALPENDPADQWVLASAISGQADVLVTGDSDLLNIASKAPLRIVSPRASWEAISRTSAKE